MKKCMTGLGAVLCFCGWAHSQEVTPPKYSLSATDGVSIASAFYGPRSNPDAITNHAPDGPWLRQFSSLLLERITYPARGKAYGIEGKMFVTIGIDARGAVTVLSYDHSLGTDFEQAIRTAAERVPRSKIKHLALPLGGYIRFTLPIYFKE
jgi:hypothetical protein